jgi:hypothetical protein
MELTFKSRKEIINEYLDQNSLTDEQKEIIISLTKED